MKDSELRNIVGRCAYCIHKNLSDTAEPCHTCIAESGYPLWKLADGRGSCKVCANDTCDRKVKNSTCWTPRPHVCLTCTRWETKEDKWCSLCSQKSLDLWILREDYAHGGK